MLCLFRGESYRLKRNKSFYICMASMAAFILMMYGMLLLVDSISIGSMENGFGGVVVSGEMLEAGESIWNSVGMMDVLGQVFSGNGFSLILAIFVSIFVVREYSCGAVKNIVGKGYSRAVIFFTRILTVNLAALLLMAAGLCVTLLCGLIFMGKGAFSGIFWQNLAGYVLAQALLSIALATVLTAISEAVRNLAAGISIGIAASVFFGLFLNGLDLLLAKTGFTISRYWLVSRSSTCPVEGLTAGYLGETLAVALVWFLVAFGLGLWHFQKADIK